MDVLKANITGIVNSQIFLNTHPSVFRKCHNLLLIFYTYLIACFFCESVALLSLLLMRAEKSSNINFSLHFNPLMWPDVLLPTHEWAQCFRNMYTAVCLLVNLEQRQEDAWRSNRCIVQGMDKLYFAILVTVADIHATCLPFVEVRARVSLAISPLARYPALNVVH